MSFHGIIFSFHSHHIIIVNSQLDGSFDECVMSTGAWLSIAAFLFYLAAGLLSVYCLMKYKRCLHREQKFSKNSGISEDDVESQNGVETDNGTSFDVTQESIPQLEMWPEVEVNCDGSECDVAQGLLECGLSYIELVDGERDNVEEPNQEEEIVFEDTFAGSLPDADWHVYPVTQTEEDVQPVEADIKAAVEVHIDAFEGEETSPALENPAGNGEETNPADSDGETDRGAGKGRAIEPGTDGTNTANVVAVETTTSSHAEATPANEKTNEITDKVQINEAELKCCVE
jgi:hypothetical protein